LSQPGEVLVCLAGPCGRPEVDVIQVVRLGETAPALCSGCANSSAGGIGPQVFSGLLKLAVELAQEGREGRPIGTTFVLGDHEKVLQFSRQAVLNPFAGYPEEALSVLSQEMKETIREFSSLDGAFVVRGDGVLLAAGRHIQASAADVELPQGMGARHHAAAGISAVTAAMAMVISESSGTVTVFNKGQIVASLEKARPNLMAEARF
jgi:DNA integrity scanning protein DisA with diadenylate cyclase activity